jgi:hypothetical protein
MEELPMRRITLALGLLTFLMVSAKSARAIDLNLSSHLCAVPVWLPGSSVPIPHVFLSGNLSPTQLGLFVSWGTDAGWNWGAFSAEAITSRQIACAGFDDQAMVIYRKQNATADIVARGRLSNWTETLLGNFNFSSSPSGLWATTVKEGGVNKIPTFIVTNAGTLAMKVWEQGRTTNGGWDTTWTDLGAVPGGFSSLADLSGYAVLIGTAPNFTGLVSVFIIAMDGSLKENKGPIRGSRTWINHGNPGSVLEAQGNKPAAFQWGNFNPTSTWTENDFNKRVSVPLASGTGVYTRMQTGTAPWSWQQIASSTTTPQRSINMVSAGYVNCTSGSCDRDASVRTIGINHSGAGAYQLNTHTSRAQSSGSWSVLFNGQPIAAAGAEGSKPILMRSGSNLRVLYVESTQSLKMFDFLSNQFISMGHP